MITIEARKLKKENRCKKFREHEQLAADMSTAKETQDAYVKARITHPDGSTLTWDEMACGVKNNGAGGKATDVGALEAELVANGKPTEGTVSSS